MKENVIKTDWDYRVYVVGHAWLDGKPHYTGITYSDKKDAIEALEYYGKGYVEANRYIIGDGYCQSEYKIIIEMV